MARGPTESLHHDAETLRAELARARERIHEQQTLLAEAHRQVLATSRFTGALGQLSRSTTLERGGLIAALVELITAAAECLEVARVGVWLADEPFERLECVALSHQGVVSRRPGTVIDRSLYPTYFEHIAEARVLAADDVAAHPATRELLAGYLGPLGITSMLDAPVRVFGRVVGIVCHEHLGPPRHWSDAEQAFAAHLGDFVALAVEAVRRDDARRAELEAEARYRQLVEGLPATIYRIEPERGITYVSPQIARLTGREPARWHGVDGLRAWLDLVHPDDRDRVRERLRGSVLAHDRGTEYRILPDGQELWVHDVSHVLRGNDGSVLAVEGVLGDVTERARADAKVHEWERRFQGLFRRGDLTMATFDVEGRVTFASDAFLTLVERSEADATGRGLADLVPTVDVKAMDAALRRVASGEVASAQCDVAFPAPISDVRAFVMGEGDRTVRFTLTPLYEGSAPPTEGPQRLPRAIGVIAVGLDVTPLIERANGQHDRDKEASLSRLAAGVAHDLNNVLGALRLTASILASSEDREVRREALQNLSDCGQQAAELTQRLMDIARSRPSSAEDLEVDRHLEVIEPLLRAMLAGTSIGLELVLDAPGAWARIGDTELRQILLNLVSNARDAAPPSSRITIRSAILVIPDPTVLGHTLGGGRFVVVEVEDQGPGIDGSMRRRIFEPYFTTKGTKGTGLGLSSSRALARRAGGDLRAEGGSEGGARLVLLLPLQPAPTE